MIVLSYHPFTFVVSLFHNQRSFQNSQSMFVVMDAWSLQENLKSTELQSMFNTTSYCRHSKFQIVDIGDQLKSRWNNLSYAKELRSLCNTLTNLNMCGCCDSYLDITTTNLGLL